MYVRCDCSIGPKFPGSQTQSTMEYVLLKTCDIVGLATSKGVPVTEVMQYSHFRRPMQCADPAPPNLANEELLRDEEKDCGLPSAEMWNS